MGVTSGPCHTHDLPHPFTLEINNFLMEAQSEFFSKVKSFYSVLRDNSHTLVSPGVVLQANSHSSKVTQPRLDGVKKVRKARGETRVGEGR